MRDGRTILIYGGGGREHALYCALDASPYEPRVLCAPGNGGIPPSRRRQARDDTELTCLIQDEGIDLVIYGPEQPLVKGDADWLRDNGIAVFGPSKKAAEFEGSKVFAREFCKRNGIPVPRFLVAMSMDEAREAIRQYNEPPVIKADGVCAGKGVVVADSVDEAIQAASDMLEGDVYGAAGWRILVEERLTGREASIMAFCKGREYKLLPPSRDHKRAGEGDTGPNTGGMGAYSPVPDITPDILEKVRTRILEPFLRGAEEEGRPFSGLLYIGIMVVKEDPYVIEFNVRFGDPETQAVLPRIASDLLPYFLACVGDGSLNDLPELQVREDVAVGVTLAMRGYPGHYEKGQLIRIGAIPPSSRLYHAGTEQNRSLVTNGGRVMTAVGFGKTFFEARDRANALADAVFYTDKVYRSDIAADL